MFKTKNFKQDGSTKPKSLFNDGDKVYLDFSKGSKKDIRGPLTVDGKPYFQPLTRIFMYKFKESEICCGECYVKATKNEDKKPISSFLHDVEDHTGAFTESVDWQNEGKLIADGMRSPGNQLTMLFFRPDNDLIQWLKKYANGRVIVDIGCGGGWLLRKLHYIGQPVLGIEPMWSADDAIQMNTVLMENGRGIINVLPRRVEECGTMIQQLAPKALFIFARPCHSDYVENAIRLMPKGSEALYITVKKNLTEYDDLGVFREKAKLLKHEGNSVDKEMIFSIKK